MSSFRFLAAAIAAVALALGSPGRSAHAQTAVDLELVLAVDVSWSMDLEEQRLQRDGYVAAFRDGEVQRAIRSGPARRIAVSYVEWAGAGIQTVVIPWTIVGTPEEAERFADELAAKPISRARMTSISGALEFSGRHFNSSGVTGSRRVIDISGDGPNNSGSPVVPSRDRLVDSGVTINGLPIIIRPSMMSGWFDIANLEDYYRECVIGGVGAFVIAIKDSSEFATAIRQKLLLEISGPTPWQGLMVPAQLKPPPADIDCLVGEKLWRQYMDR